MKEKSTARAALIVVLVGVLSIAIGLLGVPAGANHVTPTTVSGNPGCGDLGNYQELKVEPPNSGTYGDGTLSVTITRSGESFSWSSNIGVDAVIVKGGPNANVYSYSPEATSDSNLTAPKKNGETYGLSHISFCYDVEQPSTPPTTPSTPPPTTPSTPPPTTPPPTSPPPTSPAPTISPTVLPTRATQSPSPDLTEQPASPQPSPTDTVQGKRVTGGGELPFTGTTIGLILIAAGLIGGGGWLVAVRRRRRVDDQ